MGNTVTYYFGRLNVIANTNDKKAYMQRTLNAGTYIKVREFEWSFFEVNEEKIGDEYYFYGCLAKSKPNADEDVIDRTQHAFSKVDVQDKVIAKSQFILHIKSGVIAYRPVSNKISMNQFRQNFAALIEATNEYLLVKASIEVIDEESVFLEAIKKLDKISYIAIELHPSNPSNRERWRRTDERLKQMKVEKYKESYESKAGILLNEQDDVYGHILMAVDGYGKAFLSGSKDGSKHIVSTEKMPVQIEIPIEMKHSERINVIISKFKAIWERTRHEEM